MRHEKRKASTDLAKNPLVSATAHLRAPEAVKSRSVTVRWVRGKTYPRGFTESLVG